jgi:D-aspartate ligase
MTHRPPVLLTVGRFYGTLAAVRNLGRAGVSVTMAEGHAFAPARWSRYVDRRVRCPDASASAEFLAWLCAFGAASPGHVLLPTSDEIASLIADNQEALSRHFILLETAPRAVNALLDKHALLGCCNEVGLEVPDTWFPRSVAEAIEIGARVGAPLLLKPRTQVLLESHSKGAMVENLASLPEQFRAFVAANRYGEPEIERNPDVAWPMLQRLYPSAKTSIYGISGYCAAGGEVVAVRASRKILQRPRKLGIGLCFEEAPVDETLVRKLSALCKRVGFRGVFEVEFIDDGARRLLIDFNPRFYSQLAFDIDRGMPLPLLAYYDAIGDTAQLAATVSEARPRPIESPQVYCHRFILEVMLRAQRMSGRLTADEERHWRGWLSEHRANASDAVADSGDLVPWGIDVLAHLADYARHPRAFLRSMVLDM